MTPEGRQRRTRDPWTTDARQRITNIARTLTRAVKTLTYVGVGCQDFDKDMYDVDGLWFRVASRAEDEAQTVHLETLSEAEGERIREYLQDSPRE